MAVTIRRAKTETLSLRLDPKTKFMLDFLSRVEGQSITTVVERAVREFARNVKIGSEYDVQRDWSAFWDASEGVRTLYMLADHHYPTNFEEDEKLAFARAHWQFFFTSDSYKTPRRAYVDVLWPKIEEYLTIWRDQKQTDYWAAGEAMKRDLRAAKVAPPDWPQVAKGPKETFDLDDEIPF